MIRHYFVSALRSSRRSLWVALVNLLGLAIGTGICILVFIFVRYELSYDRFFADHERIFRVEKESSLYGGTRSATVPGFVFNALSQFDEVEAIGAIGPWRASTVRNGSNIHKEDLIHAVNPGLFDVFSFEILEGNPKSQLDRPFVAVLTESFKNRYFQNETALGKTIEIDTLTFEVVGVIKDLPAQSHGQFGIMVSEISQILTSEFPEELRVFGFHRPTYVKLKDWVDPENLATRVFDLPSLVASEHLQQTGDRMNLFLRELDNIHLYGPANAGNEAPGNPTLVYVMGIIGILVLILTSFNFMNLSTARFITRSREVGVRKVFGARHGQLVFQFMGETLLLAFFAHILGMFCIELSLGALNRVTGLSMTIEYLDPIFLLTVISLILFTGILAGLYPALVMSSLKPAMIFRNASNPGIKGIQFRRILVIAQFTISIALIIGSILVNRQLHFLKNEPLGFDKKNKLVFQIPEGQVTPQNYERIKDQFASHSGVRATTFSSSVPGRWRYWWRLNSDGDVNNTHMVNCFQVDFDYFDIYGLEMLLGEKFRPELGRQANAGMIMNEAAVETFGWGSPEAALDHRINNRDLVKGVCKNYHFKGLNQELTPLGIFLIGEDFRYLTLVYDPTQINEVLDFSKNLYREIFPGYAEDYFFLEEDFDKQFTRETTTAWLVIIFTVMAVVIACMGLFGMSLYILQQKRQEIGIRKVNGAGFWDIYWEVSQQFLKWIGISYLLALPIMIWASEKWLNTFPYHVRLSWWIFGLTAVIIGIITILTLSYQIIKAVRTNPIKTLRME